MDFLVSSDSSKKRTNRFVFSTVRQKKPNSFVRFFGRIRGYQKSFWNYLTFRMAVCDLQWPLKSQGYYSLVEKPLWYFKNSLISECDFWFWITVSRPRLSKVSSTLRLKKEGKSEKTFTSPLSPSLSGLHTNPASIMARRRITKKVPPGLLNLYVSYWVKFHLLGVY